MPVKPKWGRALAVGREARYASQAQVRTRVSGDECVCVCVCLQERWVGQAGREADHVEEDTALPAVRRSPLVVMKDERKLLKLRIFHHARRHGSALVVRRSWISGSGSGWPWAEGRRWLGRLVVGRGAMVPTGHVDVARWYRRGTSTWRDGTVAAAPSCISSSAARGAPGRAWQTKPRDERVEVWVTRARGLSKLCVSRVRLRPTRMPEGRERGGLD